LRLGLSSRTCDGLAYAVFVGGCGGDREKYQTVSLNEDQMPELLPTIDSERRTRWSPRTPTEISSWEMKMI